MIFSLSFFLCLVIYLYSLLPVLSACKPIGYLTLTPWGPALRRCFPLFMTAHFNYDYSLPSGCKLGLISDTLRKLFQDTNSDGLTGMPSLAAYARTRHGNAARARISCETTFGPS